MRAKKAIKITALVLLFTLIFIILGGVLTVFFLTKDTNLKNNDLNSVCADLRVVNAAGEEIEYYSKYKAEVSYQDISPYIVNAFVALEDKRFYEHHGLDYKRIAGAIVNNIKAGYLKEGGSTITQQLAKNAILTNEKSLVRKLKEAKLAIQIEKHYSKDEIMTMYLNTIYFGHSLYGVKAACARLFDKTPAEVTLAEAAMLAGIVKNPLKNSPLNSVENAIARRDLVLKLMSEQGYIEESEYENALKATYVAPPGQKKDTASGSYANAAIYEAAELLGKSVKEVITGGYTVETYCDPEAQNALVRVYGSEALDVENAEKILLLADNVNGGVSAYISGVGVVPAEFRRQPASTIKPILAYAPAFDLGIYFPASPIEDKIYDFNGYSPKNYQNSYLGWTTVRKAILTSSNACALKTVADIGLERAFGYAEKLGLKFDTNDGAASVLGGMTYGVTPLEITEAYMTLAAGGIHRELKFVSEIKDKNGKTVYLRPKSAERVISAEAAYIMTDILKDCATVGTASKLKTLNSPIAAKTGTNGDENGNYDAWNMSYTTKYTLCSWYGAGEGKQLPTSVTGGSYPTLAARTVYGYLKKPADFTEPEGIIYADIDSYCCENSHILKLANENTPYEYREKAMFSANHIPETSDYFDDALPSDFEVALGDGEIILSLTASEKFDYYLFDLDGTEILKIAAGSGYTETAVPVFGFGIEGYYVEARTEDGVSVAESVPRIVLVTDPDPFFGLFGQHGAPFIKAPEQ